MRNYKVYYSGYINNVCNENKVLFLRIPNNDYHLNILKYWIMFTKDVTRQSDYYT